MDVAKHEWWWRGATWLVGGLVLVWLAHVVPTRMFEHDFANYYASSRLLLEGKNPYRTPLAGWCAAHGFAHADDIPVATNPPPLLYAFALVAWWPPAAGFVGWLVVQAASLGVIFWLTRRLLGDRLGPQAWRLVVVGTLASEPVFWHLLFSQVQLPLAALVLAGYYWHQQERPLLACAAVTLAGLLKLYPLLLVPWFVWHGGNKTSRVRRAAVVAGVTLLVVGGSGIGLWRDFGDAALPGLTTYAVGHRFNSSVPALVAQLACVIQGGPVNRLAAGAWWWVAVAAGALVIGLAYERCRRLAHDPEAAFSLLSVAMLAGAIMTWGHYYVFLVFPVAAMVARLRVGENRRQWLWLALAILLMNAMNVQLPGPLWLKVLLSCLPLCGATILGVLWYGHRPALAPGAFSLSR